MDNIELQQALSAKSHLKVLQSRVLSLQNELELALNSEEIINREIEYSKSKLEEAQRDIYIRREKIEDEYRSEIQEYKKQNRLIEEMLDKKKEERRALLDYLYSLKMPIKLPEDLKSFDWTSLKKVMTNSRKNDLMEAQNIRATLLADRNSQMRALLKKIKDLFSSTQEVKFVNNESLEELKCRMVDWKETIEVQEKRISKMQVENERLSLLIKQCAHTNEPISEFMAKNVREKCHSFLNSNNPNELLEGLTRYKSRQERMIKLLKHKEMKLGQETNLLRIATDQTADQMQYYVNFIQTNNNTSHAQAKTYNNFRA